MSPIFREISCAHFSRKLKDENRQKKNCHFFTSFFAHVGENLRQNFALGAFRHKRFGNLLLVFGYLFTYPLLVYGTVIWGPPTRKLREVFVGRVSIWPVLVFCIAGWRTAGLSDQGYGSYAVHACCIIFWLNLHCCQGQSCLLHVYLVCSWNEVGDVLCQVSSSPFCTCPFWRMPTILETGKAAKCRQKVCSSKRPPKLEPRSVRPNEVFENLASRICPEKQRIGQGRSVREKSVRANDPIKMKKLRGHFP